MKPILIDLPMPIETPNLMLRPPCIGEGALLNAAILETFDSLHQWMLWAKEKPSLTESEEVVRKAAANWILKKNEDPDLLLFIIDKKTNELIGATGFHTIDWDVPCLETGYWVRERFSGQGLMTEAINALTHYAFKEIKVKRIAITCDVDNLRSKKIPERLGYRLEAVVKANRLKPITGEITDTFIYTRNDLNGIPELEVIWKK